MPSRRSFTPSKTIVSKEQAIIDASSPSFSNSLAISPFRRTTTIKTIVRASRFDVKRCRNSQQCPDRPAGQLLGFAPRVSARRHPSDNFTLTFSLDSRGRCRNSQQCPDRPAGQLLGFAPRVSARRHPVEHGSPAICASGPLPSVQTTKSPPSGVCRACTTNNRGCRRASCQADARSLVHAHLRNRKITAALGIGHAGVRYHVRNIFAKLDARTPRITRPARPPEQYPGADSSGAVAGPHCWTGRTKHISGEDRSQTAAPSGHC